MRYLGVQVYVSKLLNYTKEMTVTKFQVVAAKLPVMLYVLKPVFVILLLFKLDRLLYILLYVLFIYNF